MTQPLRVLVVDDSATIRRVVGAVLRRAHHEVAVAPDGDAGLVEVANFRPDIVLLDFSMPGLSSAGFLERLVDSTKGTEIPVVLMATRGDAVPDVDGDLNAESGPGGGSLRSAGVVDVITKPFSPEALLAVLNHSLEKHGRRERKEATRVVAALASITPAAEAADAAAKNERETNDFPQAFEVDDVTERTRPSHIGSTRNAPATEMAAPGRSASASASASGVAAEHSLVLPPGIALAGDLGVIALPEVLQLLKFQGHSGVLWVDAGGLRFELGLENGAVVALAAREPDGAPALRGDHLLGGYFVAAGIVDVATLEAHLAQGGTLPLGERLVEAGVITGDDLRTALGEQTQDLMVELLRRRRGVFALSAVQAPRLAVRPGWNVDVLMFEALRRIDEWAVIESEVPSFDACFTARISPSGAADESGLSLEEATVLRQLSGGPTAVREIVKRSSLRPFDVCRVIYRLAVLNRVRRTDDGDHSRMVSEESDRVPVLSTPPREVS